MFGDLVAPDAIKYATEFVSAVTGWERSVDETLKVGESHVTPAPLHQIQMPVGHRVERPGVHGDARSAQRRCLAREAPEALASNASAFLREASVASRPPSIRASSITLPSASRATTSTVARPRTIFLRHGSDGRPWAATWGRWVTQRAWFFLAIRERRAPTASAVAPADPRIDLVEHQHPLVSGILHDPVQGQHEPGELASARDFRQRARRLPGIRREQELDPLGSPAMDGHAVPRGPRRQPSPRGGEGRFEGRADESQLAQRIADRLREAQRRLAPFLAERGGRVTYRASAARSSARAASRAESRSSSFDKLLGGRVARAENFVLVGAVTEAEPLEGGATRFDFLADVRARSACPGDSPGAPRPRPRVDPRGLHPLRQLQKRRIDGGQLACAPRRLGREGSRGRLAVVQQGRPIPPGVPPTFLGSSG